MTKNIGTLDRTLRIIVGVVILALGLWLKSWWGLIGLLLIATAAVGWCPPYSLLGISTCKTTRAQQ